MFPHDSTFQTDRDLNMMNTSKDVSDNTYATSQLQDEGSLTGEYSHLLKNINCKDVRGLSEKWDEDKCGSNTEKSDENDDSFRRVAENSQEQANKGDTKAGNFLQVDIIEQIPIKKEVNTLEEMVEVSSCDSSVSEPESEEHQKTQEPFQIHSEKSENTVVKHKDTTDGTTPKSENVCNMKGKIDGEQVECFPKVNSVIGGYTVHHVVAALHDYYAQLKGTTAQGKLSVKEEKTEVSNSQGDQSLYNAAKNTTSKGLNIPARKTFGISRNMQVKRKKPYKKQKDLKPEEKEFLADYKKRIQLLHEHELRILERKLELERRKERLKQDKCKFEEEMRRKKLEFETELEEKYRAAIAEMKTQENILRANSQNKLIELLS